MAFLHSVDNQQMTFDVVFFGHYYFLPTIGFTLSLNTDST